MINGFEVAMRQMGIWHDQFAKTEKNRFRADGVTPYSLHLLAVFKRAYDDGIRSISDLISALFHDVLEDTKVTSTEFIKFLSTLEQKPSFARSVFQTCSDLTDFNDKFPIIDTLSRKERKNITNSHIANYACPGALIVKIYDRWHNLFSLNMQPSFRKRYLEESEGLFKALRDGFERTAPLVESTAAINIAKKRLEMMEKEYYGTDFFIVINSKTDEIVNGCIPSDRSEYSSDQDLIFFPISRDQFLNLGDATTNNFLLERWLARKAHGEQNG